MQFPSLLGWCHLRSEDGEVLKTQESKTMTEDMTRGGEAAWADSDSRSRHAHCLGLRGIDVCQGLRSGTALVVLGRRWLILLLGHSPLVQGGVHSFALAPIMAQSWRLRLSGCPWEHSVRCPCWVRKLANVALDCEISRSWRLRDEALRLTSNPSATALYLHVKQGPWRIGE